MSPDVLLIGIEASHSMANDSLGKTRFMESLSYAADLSDSPLIFCFNNDWFLVGDDVEKTPLVGSGLLRVGMRGGLELALELGATRLIIFTDGVGELAIPKLEAGALATAEIKLDIVFVGVDPADLEVLRTLADVAGGNAILLQDPPEEEETTKESRAAELTKPSSAEAGPDVDEQVIDIKPKTDQQEEANGFKGMFTKIKDKVW